MDPQPSPNDRVAKIQPWKAHWPPKTPVKAGEKHGFAKGETLRLEGSAGPHPMPTEDKKEQ